MWRPGKIVLDEFEVVRELGAGGMATVYLLKQLDRNESFAAKVPHPCFAESSTFRESLAREIQAWCALPKHPHITQCLFLREDEDRPVIFTEYVEAGTIGSWRESRRLRGIGHVVDIAIQVSEALLAAERIRLVHHDVKPSNCLMDNMGRVKVSDFGLASTSLDVRGNATRDAAPRFMGTVPYCSPEQLDGDNPDIRSDIWAYGVMLLELLTGRKPAYGPAANELLQDHRSKYGDGSIPPEMWELLTKMFAIDRSERPQSFSEVGEPLRVIYARATGKPYERRFPTPFVGEDGCDATGASLVDQATRLLRLAMRSNHRSEREADRFRLSLPTQGRGTTQDAMGAITICAETERLLRRAIASDTAPITAALLAATVQLTANSHRQAGNLQGAAQAYGRLIEELKSLVPSKADSDKTGDLRLALAKAFQNRAICLRQAGNATAAGRDYDEAIRLLKPVSGDRSSPSTDNTTAEVIQNKAIALLNAGNLYEAAAEIEQAVALRKQVLRVHPSWRLDLASTLLNRGVIRRNLGQIEAAVEDYSACIDISSDPSAGGEFGSREEIISSAYVNRAAAYQHQNRLPAAKQDADRAIQQLLQWEVPGGGNKQLIRLAQALNNRAHIFRLLGDSSSAMQDIRRCIEIRTELVEQRGQEELTASLAKARLNEALFWIDRGQHVRAWPICEEIVEWLDSLVTRKGRVELRHILAKAKLLAGQVYANTSSPEVGFDHVAVALKDFQNLSPDHIDHVDGCLEAAETLLRLASACDRRDEAFRAINDALQEIAADESVRQRWGRNVTSRLRGLRSLTIGWSQRNSHASALLQQLDSLLADSC